MRKEVIARQQQRPVIEKSAFLTVTVKRRAGAEQVAVAVHVVDPVDRRPVFVAPQGRHRVGGLLAVVGMFPDAGCNIGQCVRGVG